jgi:hypothetical protein
MVVQCGICSAKDLPIDVQTEVVPAGLSKSELDSWLSQNRSNFDFYVEGRTVADNRKDTERKVLAARKLAQESVARIDARLKEQMTGDERKDKELLLSGEVKKQRVCQEELAMEEALFERQLRREVDIMKRKQFSETRIANVQREFRDQLASLKKSGISRLTAAAAGLPAADPDISQETGGRTKVTMGKDQKLGVEQRPYGGEMSDRAKRRLQNR